MITVLTTSPYFGYIAAAYAFTLIVLGLVTIRYMHNLHTQSRRRRRAEALQNKHADAQTPTPLP